MHVGSASESEFEESDDDEESDSCCDGARGNVDEHIKSIASILGE